MIAPSRERWVSADFAEPFGTYRGCNALVRNHVKNPDKWGARGPKSWGFLARELGDMPSLDTAQRAVSSDCTLHETVRDRDGHVLRQFVELTGAMSSAGDATTKRHGLLLSAAVSSDDPRPAATAGKILASRRPAEPNTYEAALEVAGLCFRSEADFRVLWRHAAAADASIPLLTAIERVMLLRSAAVASLDARSADAILTSVIPLLESGLHAERDMQHAGAAASALAALLRRRIQDPGFLAPGSKLHARLRAALVVCTESLARRQSAAARAARDAVDRLAQLLDGEPKAPAVAAERRATKASRTARAAKTRASSRGAASKTTARAADLPRNPSRSDWLRLAGPESLQMCDQLLELVHRVASARFQFIYRKNYVGLATGGRYRRFVHFVPSPEGVSLRAIVEDPYRSARLLRAARLEAEDKKERVTVQLTPESLQKHEDRVLDLLSEAVRLLEGSAPETLAPTARRGDHGIDWVDGEPLALCEQMLDIVNAVATARFELVDRGSYVGMATDGSYQRFAHFLPRPPKVWLKLRLPEAASTIGRLEAAGLHARARKAGLSVLLDGASMAQNQALVTEVITAAVRHWDPRRCRAAGDAPQQTVGTRAPTSMKDQNRASESPPRPEPEPVRKSSPLRAAASGPERGPRAFVPDPSQQAVIEAPRDAFLVVTAPPGAGKTEVACARIAWLANQGVPPARMLMVSFTRGAVHVFRDRIANLAPDVPDIHGVEITTLDSHAWQLLRGLDGQDAQELLSGGFDQNIQTVTDKLRDGHPELVDWLSGYDHIVVDEAQDLVGARAALVLTLVQRRSPTCGVTVFGDRAQAIYGFVGESSDEDEEPGGSFFDLLDASGMAHDAKMLEEIHRTDCPALRELFLAGRDDLCSAVKEPQAVYEGTRTRIAAHGTEEPPEFQDLIPELDGRDALVLFRTRAQVLTATGYLLDAGVPHRLRLAGSPHIIEPWIGFLLTDFCDPRLVESELEELWSRHAEHPCVTGSGRTFESAWKALRDIAPGPRESVDMTRLRRQLSRSRPPITVASPETGIRGPVLGTIHASKGREAREVILMLPRSEGAARPNGDLREESRILYVGATRAVESLEIGRSFSIPAAQLEGGRVYRRNKDRKAQVEVGREGDVEGAASAGRAHYDTAAACRAAQHWLAAHAGEQVKLTARQTSEALQYRYQLQVDDGPAVGMLSSRVNSDLFAVAKACNISSARPPAGLPFLFMTGVTTVALDAEDPKLEELHEPYASSGLFLAPVVRGFSMVHFFTTQTRSREW